MDSTDLAFFLAVIEEGGVTAAARRMNCVQSNVTARIRSLEAALGLPLFHRNGRGLLPTRAGERLLPHARQVAAALRAARDSLWDLMNPDRPGGELILGSMESTAACRLPAVLAAYHRDFPDVELNLHTGATAGLVDEVLAFRLDAALVCGPVDHPNLASVDVGTERMVIATALGVDWTQARARSGLAVLCFRRGCAYRDRLEGLMTDLRLHQPRFQEFGTLEGIIGGVAAGIGVALLPAAAARQSPLAGALSLHDVPAPWSQTRTQLVHRRDTVMTAALARFIDYARLGWDNRIALRNDLHIAV